jgi:hypothetical protein
MDARLEAAARALSVFDPLAALQDVALRSDPPGLAMRGIAMAQLGEFAMARRLLRRAAAAFAPGQRVARFRCVAAEAEVALACRDFEAARQGFERAATHLAALGDVENALFARLQLVRRLVWLGKLNDAARSLASLDLVGAPARIVAVAELVGADIGVRSVRPRIARLSLERARAAARVAAIPSLTAEVDHAVRMLDAPVARLRVSGAERFVDLDEAEAVLRSRAFVVDACRREVHAGGAVVSLVARPVLFSLVVALGEAAPGEATRELLVHRAFFARTVNDSLRARLRVEIGRLRRLLGAMADVQATTGGFTIVPLGAARGSRSRGVPVLLPPTPGDANALVALLGGGEAWSTSALAAALCRSQRAIQRALGALEAEGRVQAIGRGRARRWMAPGSSGFATTLLLAPTKSTG